MRNLAGFDFPGTDPSMVARIAVAQLADPETLPPGFNRVPAGMLIVSPPPAPSMTIEFGAVPPDRHAEMTAEEFQASLRRISGTDVTVTDITSAYRITDNARQASTYRRGRVLLAGDAAHVHSPIGGQGLNLGLQDAANLGWKLGLVVRGLALEELLDTYTSERHPVGVQVLRNSRAETALLRTDPQTEALREILTELVGIPRAARFFVEMINGVQVRYDCGDDAHSLAGQFVPDLRLSGVKGIGRISELLRDGRGLLLDLADAPPLRNVAAAWGDRVKVVTGACPDRDDLAALLVRPDGYVAWAASAEGEAVRERAELGRALATWFGSDPMYR